MILHACQKHKISNMELITELEDQGWHIDRFGYAQKTTAGWFLDVPVQWRWKFQHHSIRVERQIKLNKNPEWLRIRSITYDGNIIKNKTIGYNNEN